MNGHLTQDNFVKKFPTILTRWILLYVWHRLDSMKAMFCWNRYPPKSNIDTKNDGFLNVSPFNGYFGSPAVSFRGCRRCSIPSALQWNRGCCLVIQEDSISEKKYASNGVVIERYSLYSNYWRYTSHNQGSIFKLLEITYSIGKTKVWTFITCSASWLSEISPIFHQRMELGRGTRCKHDANPRPATTQKQRAKSSIVWVLHRNLWSV